MNEELSILIIKELRKHRDRRDLIRQVCEHGGLSWKEAERLTILIEARHRRALADTRPQTPWLLFLSIGALLLGIGLLAFNLQMVLAFFEKDILSQVKSLQSSSYQVIGVFTGLGMTIAGLVGLWKAFDMIFPQ
jgi:hypothetical protein